MASLFGKGTKVVIHEDGIADFLSMNKQVRDMMVGVAQQVAATAETTANAAQKGPGGRIDGYAEAGFSVEWEARGGRRPRVNVKSNADPATALAAHFHTQLVNGVGHLRAALYEHSTGEYKTFKGRYKR